MWFNTKSIGIFLCMTAVTWAAPLVGSYKSPDAGDDFLNGRWSESFAGGGEFLPGNVIHAASWDEASLATEWELANSTLSTVQLIHDTVVAGTGLQIYQTHYTGGVLTLTDQGPWWNAGDAGNAYLVDITHHEHSTTMTYSGGERTDLRSTVYLRGVFQDYPGYELEFMVATALQLGEGGLLNDYPAYIGANDGHWGAIQKINMQIVPEPATLGLLGLGSLALIRRKRR